MYGQDYELYRKSGKGEFAIIGTIGDKKVEIMTPKKFRILRTTTEMEGHIGNKPIKIIEKYKFFQNGAKITIYYNGEKVNIIMQQYLHYTVFAEKTRI